VEPARARSEDDKQSNRNSKNRGFLRLSRRIGHQSFELRLAAAEGRLPGSPPSWDLFWRNFSQLSRGRAALSVCCAGRLRAAINAGAEVISWARWVRR
jgi:hypothetical protein